MNALVITQDEGLKTRLGQEVKWLDKFAERVQLEDLRTVDRQAGWRTKFLLWLFEKQL